MTEKEKKYKEHFNRIGKHLHKNDYPPINLKCHPMVFRVEREGQRPKYKTVPTIDFYVDSNLY